MRSPSKTRNGDRTLAAAGPRPWNSLPVQLRNPDNTYGLFRWQLKGRLFSGSTNTALCDFWYVAPQKNTYLLTITLLNILPTVLASKDWHRSGPSIRPFVSILAFEPTDLWRWLFCAFMGHGYSSPEIEIQSQDWVAVGFFSKDGNAVCLTLVLHRRQFVFQLTIQTPSYLVSINWKFSWPKTAKNVADDLWRKRKIRNKFSKFASKIWNRSLQNMSSFFVR